MQLGTGLGAGIGAEIGAEVQPPKPEAVATAEAAGAAEAAGDELAGRPAVLPSLRLCALLTAGNEEGIEARRLCEAAAHGGGGGGGGGGGAQPDAGAGPFCAYLRHVAFADARPHLLLQPFLPQVPAASAEQ